MLVNINDSKVKKDYVFIYISLLEILVFCMLLGNLIVTSLLIIKGS